MNTEEFEKLLEVTAEFGRFPLFNDLLSEISYTQIIEFGQPSRQTILEHLCAHILKDTPKEKASERAIATLSMRHFMAKFGPTTHITISQSALSKLSDAHHICAMSAIIDNIHIPYGMRGDILRRHGILQLERELQFNV